MVKHPSGNFEISFAHCSAFMPVIVVSMLEITVFTPSRKDEPRALSYFRTNAFFAPQTAFSAGRGEFRRTFFRFLFSKCLLPVNLYFTYKNDVKSVILYKIYG